MKFADFVCASKARTRQERISRVDIESGIHRKIDRTSKSFLSRYRYERGHDFEILSISFRRIISRWGDRLSETVVNERESCDKRRNPGNLLSKDVNPVLE